MAPRHAFEVTRHQDEAGDDSPGAEGDEVASEPNAAIAIPTTASEPTAAASLPQNSGRISARGSVNSCIAARTPSRPTPDSFQPPYGSGSER